MKIQPFSVDLVYTFLIQWSKISKLKVFFKMLWVRNRMSKPVLNLIMLKKLRKINKEYMSNHEFVCLDWFQTPFELMNQIFITENLSVSTYFIYILLNISKLSNYHKYF